MCHETGCRQRTRLRFRWAPPVPCHVVNGYDRGIKHSYQELVMKPLFDLSFTRFVSPGLVKFVYILVMVLLALGYVGLVIAGFQYGVAFGWFVLVLFGPLVSLIYLVLARVGLEVLIATIRTAENTGTLVQLVNALPGTVAQPRPQYPYRSYPPAPPAAPSL
jgi:hypothetical protein